MVSVLVVVELSHDVATACPTPNETTPSCVELFPRKVIATAAATPDVVSAAATTKATICWAGLVFQPLRFEVRP